MMSSFMQSYEYLKSLREASNVPPTTRKEKEVVIRRHKLTLRDFINEDSFTGKGEEVVMRRHKLKLQDFVNGDSFSLEDKAFRSILERANLKDFYSCLDWNTPSPVRVEHFLTNADIVQKRTGPEIVYQDHTGSKSLLVITVEKMAQTLHLNLEGIYEITQLDPRVVNDLPSESRFKLDGTKMYFTLTSAPTEALYNVSRFANEALFLWSKKSHMSKFHMLIFRAAVSGKRVAWARILWNNLVKRIFAARRQQAYCPSGKKGRLSNIFCTAVVVALLSRLTLAQKSEHDQKNLLSFTLLSELPDNLSSNCEELEDSSSEEDSQSVFFTPESVVSIGNEAAIDHHMENRTEGAKDTIPVRMSFDPSTGHRNKRTQPSKQPMRSTPALPQDSLEENTVEQARAQKQEQVPWSFIIGKLDCFRRKLLHGLEDSGEPSNASLKLKFEEFIDKLQESSMLRKEVNELSLREERLTNCVQLLDLKDAEINRLKKEIDSAEKKLQKCKRKRDMAYAFEQIHNRSENPYKKQSARLKNELEIIHRRLEKLLKK